MKRLPIVVATTVALGLAGIVSTIGGLVALAQSATTAVSQVQVATFGIENMTCALCPVTVKKAMEAVEGVRSVEIDFDAKTAKVAFDPSLTTAGAIAAASTNAGYPAKHVL